MADDAEVLPQQGGMAAGAFQVWLWPGSRAVWPPIPPCTACSLGAGGCDSLTPVVCLPVPYFRLPPKVMTGVLWF